MTMAERLKAYSTKEGSKLYTLDLISSIILLQTGFISHPKFNELAQLGDPKEYYELVRDEFRQLNTYMIEKCIERNIVQDPERYTNAILRQLFTEYGHMYAEVFFEKKQLPNWDFAVGMFDGALQKYYGE